MGVLTKIGRVPIYRGELTGMKQDQDVVPFYILLITPQIGKWNNSDSNTEKLWYGKSA